MSDIIIGLTGKDYVLVACDQNVSRSIVVYKHNEDKITQISTNQLIACGGPQGDRTHFTEYIEKNASLYALRNSMSLTTHALAEFTRQQLAEALRKGPFQCNLLIGGMEEKRGAELYWIDYMGALSKVKFGAHGYASYFALSIFDRYYKSNMSLEEGLELIGKVVVELQNRFLLNFGPILIKVAFKDRTEKYIINDNNGEKKEAKVEKYKEEEKKVMKGEMEEKKEKEESKSKAMDIDTK